MTASLGATHSAHGASRQPGASSRGEVVGETTDGRCRHPSHTLAHSGLAWQALPLTLLLMVLHSADTYHEVSMLMLLELFWV